jgi:c(7)-type cytochrome triheme protein
MERDESTNIEPVGARRKTRGLSGLVSLAVLLGGLVGCVFVVLPALGLSASPSAAPRPLRAAPLTAAGFDPAVQDNDSSSFSHSIPQHASRACDSCHRREGNTAQPRLPGHNACADCHVPQFMTSGSPLCLNCHTSVESGHPLKAFPGLKSFNTRFDHAQHMGDESRPEAGCASCHQSLNRGVALSIPAGLGAHESCYQCHTAGRQAGGRDISSCGVCHAQGGYARTPTGSRAYRVSFSHAGHGARQGLGCNDCHNVRAGAPQSRQVASPRPTQHFGSGRAQSCMSCHNNRRAFGGDDFADCKRCHKGQTFRF